MGSTGGRSLIFRVLASGTNDEQSMSLVQAVPNIFRDLLECHNPDNFDIEICDPITSAKVTRLVGADKLDGITRPSSQRYSGNGKPLYVEADILLRHLGTGETTNMYPDLAKIIRNRGKGSPDDDCGHLIARANGGKMVDYNLFPQDMNINRGWLGWSLIWKWGVELLPRIWLVAMAAFDPMVRVRILLIYPNSKDSHPDRPIAMQYYLEFYKRNKSGKEVVHEKQARDNLIAVQLFIRTAIHGEIPNDCSAENPEKTKEAMKRFKSGLKKLKDLIAELDVKTLIGLFVDELDRFISLPVQEPSSCSLSWWDIVPIILVLISVLFGTLTNPFGRGMKLKESSKLGENITHDAKKSFKIAVQEMIKETIGALPITTVTQTAQRAIELVAENVD